MFPLKKRQLIRGAEGHLKAGLGVGADYVAVYDELFAPFDSQVRISWGKQGGHWISFHRDNGEVIKVAHLNRYKVKHNQRVKEGQVVAITGNTGKITTGPHAHVEVYDVRGRRVDPEQYDWNSEAAYPVRIKTAFLINFPMWPGMTADIMRLCDWFRTASRGRIELLPFPVQTRLSGWERRLNPDVKDAPMIRSEWWTDYIAPLAGDAKIQALVLSNYEWDGRSSDGLELQGYCEQFVTNPVRVLVAADYEEMSEHFPEETAFFDYLRHEIIHGLYKNGHPSKFDLTHKRFYEEKQPENCFDDFDYALLKKNLGCV